jgi:Fur family ferric uptake transcriptional regulator
MKTQRELSDLTERLRRHARKLTSPRQEILKVLRESRKPISSQAIFAALPQGQCDLATVYRSMRMLEEAKVVTRVDLGDGIARFEIVGEDDTSHHHHLICTQCSDVVEINECITRELEEGVARRHGFKGVTHRLDFFGVCPACQ